MKNWGWGSNEKGIFCYEFMDEYDRIKDDMDFFEKLLQCRQYLSFKIVLIVR